MTDLNPGTYRFCFDVGQWSESIAWLSEIPFTIYIEGLSMGVHNIQVEINGGGGNCVIQEIDVMVDAFTHIL